MELEYYTKIIGAVTASTAMIGGGYTLADKFGVFHKDILKWSPEHFQISDAPANGEFKVVVLAPTNGRTVIVAVYPVKSQGVEPFLKNDDRIVIWKTFFAEVMQSIKMAYIRFNDNFIPALDLKSRYIIDFNASFFAKCYQFPL